MPEDYLVKILDTNMWNVAQTEEAKAVKVRKAAGVQRRKAERADADDAPKCSGHIARAVPRASSAGARA